MKKFCKWGYLFSAIFAFATTSNAQDQAKQEGFIRRAFRDMKESAKLQRQIDRANFQAVKLETKAFYQAQKRMSKPSIRSVAERERMQRELEAANKRLEQAQAKVKELKNNQ